MPRANEKTLALDPGVYLPLDLAWGVPLSWESWQRQRPRSHSLSIKMGYQLNSIHSRQGTRGVGLERPGTALFGRWRGVWERI